MTAKQHCRKEAVIAELRGTICLSTVFQCIDKRDYEYEEEGLEWSRMDVAEHHYHLGGILIIRRERTFRIE